MPSWCVLSAVKRTRFLTMRLSMRAKIWTHNNYNNLKRVQKFCRSLYWSRQSDTFLAADSSDLQSTIRTTYEYIWTVPNSVTNIIQRYFHVRAKIWRPAHQNFDAVISTSPTHRNRALREQRCRRANDGGTAVAAMLPQPKKAVW